MSVVDNQAQTFLRLVHSLRPHLRTDAGLPRTIQMLLAGERRFGSRDRRLYRELIYTLLRYLPWIEPALDSDPAEALRRIAWLAAKTPATKVFVEAFATGQPPSGDRSKLLPAWFRQQRPELFSGAELEAQLRRAPLWLRLQTKDSSAATASLAANGCTCTESQILKTAWRAPEEFPIDRTDAYTKGWIEIQDLGSQLILETIGVARGEKWLDACAGAGGKSLQLAQLVGPKGSVTAHDVRPEALAELQVRAARAPIENITTTSAPAGEFDGVLIDAPCSGSGTWRRSPHLKWTTTPAMIAERAQLQRELLARFATFVRPGGRLVYATCSLSPQENEAVVRAFLEEHGEFQPQPLARTFGAQACGEAGLLILPALHDTDGFFVASLRRR